MKRILFRIIPNQVMLLPSPSVSLNMPYLKSCWEVIKTGSRPVSEVLILLLVFLK
jgi:hypothetical protein